MSKNADQFSDVVDSFVRRDLPDSEVEFTGEIPSEVLLPYRARALSTLANQLELPGFRKGHVPEEMALKHAGELSILEEAVELCMRDLYPKLVEIKKLDAVGMPDIRITKLAPGNPAGITIRTTLYPAVALPKHWQKLGTSVVVETVPDILDAEVDEALESIRRARAKVPTATESDLPKADPSVPPNAEDLPALDDTFAKSLGDFSDLADLKVKLKGNMKSEKEQKAKEARRGKIIEELLAQTKVDVPPIFIESELGKIMSQLKEDVTRFGITFDGYLKQTTKTEAQVQDEFRDQARKRAKLQLTLNKIAQDEKIEVEKDKVEEEMKHALEHFPDARPDLVRVHIETVLRNEKVLQLLESTNTKE